MNSRLIKLLSLIALTLIFTACGTIGSKQGSDATFMAPSAEAPYRTTLADKISDQMERKR